jgi:hypothetical protein
LLDLKIIVSYILTFAPLMVPITYNKDILCHLFSFLEAEIVILSKVCKFWRIISNELFHWSLVYCYSARTPIDKIEFSEIFIRRLFELCFSCPTLWRFYEEPLSVKFQINVERLEELLLAQENVIGMDELVQLLTAINTKAVHRSIFGVPKFLPSQLGRLMPPGLEKKIIKAKGIKEGTTLLPHQLEALDWMVHRENHKSDSIIYSPVYALRSSRLMSNFSPTHWLPPGSPELRADQQCNGGIFADEEGLGKGLTIVALILNNPPPPLPHPLVSPSAYTLKSLLFPSRATLIFCPLLHVDYWEHQFSTFAPNLSVIVIMEYDDIKPITYRHIVHADVVLVAYSFFTDYNYSFIGNFVTDYSDTSFTLNSPSDKLISEWISKSLMLLKYESHHGLDHPAPILEYFSYHRVIITDGQDKITNPLFRNIFKWIDSSYRWMVSANPFPSFGTIWGICEFFSLNFTDSSNSVLLDFIASKLTWRNTKNSVNLSKNSMKPNYAYKIKLLDYNDIENAINSSSKAPSLDMRLERCCLVPPSSLSRLRFDTLSSIKEDVRTLSSQLKEISLEIEESKKKIEQAKVPVGMTRQRSTKRLESRNIFSYLNKQQKMKERLLEAIDTFGLYYATKPFKGPWFDVRVLFEPMNDDTINNMLLQILGVEEYIQRRRKEREERKDFIESIKPENERASKHNMEKHKTQESAEQLPHEIDETKLKEREEQAEVISLSDVQETVDFIVKFIPEKPKKEIYSDILQTKEYR